MNKSNLDGHKEFNEYIKLKLEEASCSLGIPKKYFGSNGIPVIRNPEKILKYKIFGKI